MESSKAYVIGIIMLLFGICLGIPFRGGAGVIVGYNNWSHDTDNDFLVPTNDSVDVSLNNNSLIYANLSDYAGANITWLNNQFHVSANGTSKWTLVGNVLYTKIDGNDVQINGSLTLGGNLDMDGNDIDNAFDVYCENQLTVDNDIQLGDKLEHEGDTDTYLVFNPNQILLFAGGTQILNMQTTLATFGVDVDLDNNALLNADLSSYAGENITFDNNTMQFNVTSKGWLQNGFVNTIDSTVSFTDVDRTFMIEPVDGSFDYYINSINYTVASSDTVVIDDTEGLWYIYYDDSTLTAIHSPTHEQLETIYLNKATVGIVYWDSDNSKGQRLEERHGLSMSPYTHLYLHETVGTRYSFGLALNSILADEDGDTDTHAQFGTEVGQIFDEDLELSINAVDSTIGLQIWHRDTSLWTFTTNPSFSMLTTGSGRLAWDDGGTLTEVTNGNFVLCHVFVGSFNHSNPVVAIGQAEYLTKKLAQEAAVTEINSIVSIADVSPEIKPIATIIFQTSNSYSNSVKARIVSTDEGDDYVDWTATDLSPGRAASDHGNLVGLGDDDHTQYARIDGTRDFTGNVTFEQNITAFGGNSIEWNDAFSWGDHSLVGYLTSLLWNRSGTIMFPFYDGDDVQVNGTVNATTVNVTDNLIVDTNTLYVDSVNNRVGIGTSTPDQVLDVVGGVNVSQTVNATDINIADGLVVGGTITATTGLNFYEDSPADTTFYKWIYFDPRTYSNTIAVGDTPWLADGYTHMENQNQYTDNLYLYAVAYFDVPVGWRAKVIAWLGHSYQSYTDVSNRVYWKQCYIRTMVFNHVTGGRTVTAVRTLTNPFGLPDGNGVYVGYNDSSFVEQWFYSYDDDNTQVFDQIQIRYQIAEVGNPASDNLNIYSHAVKLQYEKL